MSQAVPPEHSPTKFSTYFSIHEKRMDGFRLSAFVREDSLEFVFQEAGLLTIKGEISCLGGVVISVYKTLEVIDDGTIDSSVQTFLYAYNALVRGENSFLRHDNTHSYPGHADEHHRHELDWRTGEELPGSPMWVGSEGWPTLSKFIEEVEGWYWSHKEELPEPDNYGAIDLRG